MNIQDSDIITVNTLPSCYRPTVSQLFFQSKVQSFPDVTVPVSLNALRLPSPVCQMGVVIE